MGNVSMTVRVSVCDIDTGLDTPFSSSLTVIKWSDSDSDEVIEYLVTLEYVVGTWSKLSTDQHGKQYCFHMCMILYTITIDDYDDWFKTYFCDKYLDILVTMKQVTSIHCFENRTSRGPWQDVLSNKLWWVRDVGNLPNGFTQSFPHPRLTPAPAGVPLPRLTPAPAGVPASRRTLEPSRLFPKYPVHYPVAARTYARTPDTTWFAHAQPSMVQAC